MDSIDTKLRFYISFFLSPISSDPDKRGTLVQFTRKFHFFAIIV